MLSLRWASIQGSSQFSYFTMSDSLSRLCTISTILIGNRENNPNVYYSISGLEKNLKFSLPFMIGLKNGLISGFCPVGK